MNRPGITLCMIVKNEVHHLAEALASVKGMANQILIGDTGSTDGTQALAASLGATVLDVPWTDDFAAARNAVLARAVQPWILYFDADERATPDVGIWLDRHLASAGQQAFRGVFVSRSSRRGFDRLCLFPNGLGIRWDRPLHEWPIWPDGRSVEGLVVPALRFEHVGDQRPRDSETVKHERYLAIEKARLVAYPDSQVDRYYVAMSELALKRYDDAYATFLAAWEKPEWRALWRPGTLAWQLADAARLADDWERWRHWAERCVADVPTFVLGWELLVRGLHKHEGIEACLDAAKGWFDACRTGEHWAEASMASHPDLLDDAWRYRVWSALACGDMDAGRYWAFQQGAPLDLAVHADLVAGEVGAAVRRYCAGLADRERALATWLGWLGAQSPVPELLPAMIWGSLRGSHYGDLAVERFEAVVQAFPASVAPRWRRALFWLRRRPDAEMALADMRWVTAHEPGNPEAWKLLAVAAERCGLADEAAAARQRAASNA
jgi:glycosyltransferase involved in cell wall biosynthesis